MDVTDATVVTAILGGGELATTPLLHLENQDYPQGRYEVIALQLDESPETRRSLANYAEGSPLHIGFVPVEGGQVGRALNQAVQQAHGRWLIFLDADLFAGPRLVAGHVDCQEKHGGDVLSYGPVAPHPQVQEDLVVAWSLYAQDRMDEAAGSHREFYEWTAGNLCVRRGRLDELHCFEPEFACPWWHGVCLTWNLWMRGISGCFSPAACAYVWHPLEPEVLHERFIEKGRILGMIHRRMRERGIDETDLLRLERYVTEGGTGAKDRLADLFGPVALRLAQLFPLPISQRQAWADLIRERALREGWRHAQENPGPRLG